MKNIFARNKRSVEVLVTLCIIALLIFYYYALYVPGKERAIAEQRFRTMRHIDNKIKDKLRGYEALLHNYLVICADKQLNFDSVERYVEGKNSPHFSLQIKEAAKTPADSLRKSRMKASHVSSGVSFLLSMDTLAPCNNINAHDTCKLTLSAEVSISDFLNPILKKDIFDEFIILNDSQVVYESFPSGLSYYKRDSLLQTKNGVSTGAYRDLQITGTNFRLFMQPVKFRDYEDWIIIGLMKKQTLNAEAHHLPGSTIEWLIVAVLLFCFLLPWIKVRLMGKSERIKLDDVVFAYICSMLLVSFIFFLAFKYNLPFRPLPAAKEFSNDSKIVIAKKMTDNFQREIEEVYDQVKVFDTLRYGNAEVHALKNLKNIENNPVAGINFGAGNWTLPLHFPDSTIKRLSRYKHFINVYWLDSTGKEMSNWSYKNDDPPPPGVFSSRNYFQKIKKGEGFIIAGKPDKKYFLEPLYSWSDRKFKVALSIPSKEKGAVAVITFYPESVIKPVMIAGYTFAIVNDGGEVLFHSDPDKNLNEHLHEEIRPAKTLNSALQTRIATNFISEYAGKKYFSCFIPLLSLPYSAIVFSDQQYKERRNIECFSFALMMFFTFFLVLCLEIVLILIASYRKTRLRKNKYSIGWIYPLESKKGVYSIVFCTYLGSLIFLTAYIAFSASLSLIVFIFIFLSSAVLLSIISSFIYTKLESFNEQSITKHFIFKNNAAGWLIALWMFINTAGVYYLRSNYIICVLIQLVILIIAVLSIRFQHFVVNCTRRFSYIHLFTAMIFMRLLITCGLPMVIFYINGYNYDQHVTTRVRLLSFAREMKAKSQDTKCFPTGNNRDCFAFYPDHSWVKGVDLVDTVIIETKKYTRADKYNLSIIHSARIGYSELSRIGDDLSNLKSGDNSWYFNSVFAKADTCYLKLSDSLPATAKQKYLRLYSDDKLNYQFPVIFNYTDPKQVLFWVLFAGLLIIFYLMLHYIVHRIYGLIVSATKGLNDMYRPVLRDDKLNNLVFINGAPGSGKMEIARKELAARGLIYDKEFFNVGSIFIIDMLDIPDSTESKEKQKVWEDHVEMMLHSKFLCIIFNHFEYNMNDQHCNRIKLNMIERFMRQGKKKLIIVSTVHQAAFLESLIEYTPKSAEEKKAMTEDLPRWDVLLGHFVNLYVSLNQEIEEICTKRPKDWTFALTIWEECRHTNFLRKLHCPMQSFVAQRLEKDKASLDKEDIILKVQSLAHLFYLYMWNSLTREEQFLLYDLAEDGLINTTNKELIRRMMNKGMIHINDGRLSLFNRSFRNFILTSISATDVKIIEDQIKDYGTWKTLRYPALLILAALSYFIFTAEQESLGDVMKYLSALAAGIPLIVKMLSFVLPADSK